MEFIPEKFVRRMLKPGELVEFEMTMNDVNAYVHLYDELSTKEWFIYEYDKKTGDAGACFSEQDECFSIFDRITVCKGYKASNFFQEHFDHIKDTKATRLNINGGNHEIDFYIGEIFRY